MSWGLNMMCVGAAVVPEANITASNVEARGVMSVPPDLL
jgi:hypothetical protein